MPGLGLGGPSVRESLDRGREAESRLRQQRPARRAQLHPPGGAKEEDAADFLLEPADLAGERLLGEPDPTGSPREAQLLGDRDEIPEPPQIHSLIVQSGQKAPFASRL